MSKKQRKPARAEIRVDGMILPASDGPSDKTFRGAWSLDEKNAVVIDMEAARKVHIERLRQARAPMLAALDVEYQRADEEGDSEKKAAIVAKKKKLRDVTASEKISKAQTPDELKALTIEALIG